jgi:hypothetical protein
MELFDLYDQILFALFIFLGVFGGTIGMFQFFDKKYRLEKWYILSKTAACLYVAIVYFLVWSPVWLNDPWITRQCVRGIVLVAVGLWVLDTAMRKFRRFGHD